MAAPSAAEGQPRRMRPGAVFDLLDRHEKWAGQSILLGKKFRKGNCNRSQRSCSPAMEDIGARGLYDESAMAGDDSTMDRIAMLNEILTQNPKDAFARYGLAMEYSKRASRTRARGVWQLLIEHHPDYTAGYFMAAQTLVKASALRKRRKC